jgi:hypothetical protein
VCYPGNTADMQPQWALTYCTATSRSQQQIRTEIKILKLLLLLKLRHSVRI